MQVPGVSCNLNSTEFVQLFFFLQESCTSEYVCMVTTYSKDQPGKFANPARGQLNRENEYFPVPVRA